MLFYQAANYNIFLYHFNQLVIFIFIICFINPLILYLNQCFDLNLTTLYYYSKLFVSKKHFIFLK